MDTSEFHKNESVDRETLKLSDETTTELKKAGIWQVALVVLGILLVVSFFAWNFSETNSTNLTGNAVADKTITFINQNLLQGKGTATLKNVKETNGLYNIQLNVVGQEVDSYATKDGELWFPQSVNLNSKPEVSTNSQKAISEINKSSKPKLELFIMSHCPYGLQMEKGIIPILNVLGTKLDAKIRFVHYFMHGDKEEKETYNQVCIREEQPDKYLAYLGCFIEDGNTERCLTKSGIDKVKLNSCLANNNTKAKEYYEQDKALSTQYSVEGSPTLVINGQIAESGRDAQSTLNTVCKAFTSSPEECTTDMTSFGTPSPGFGFGTQGGSATSAGCGV